MKTKMEGGKLMVYDEQTLEVGPQLSFFACLIAAFKAQEAVTSGLLDILKLAESMYALHNNLLDLPSSSFLHRLLFTFLLHFFSDSTLLPFLSKLLHSSSFRSSVTCCRGALDEESKGIKKEEVKSTGDENGASMGWEGKGEVEP